MQENFMHPLQEEYVSKCISKCSSEHVTRAWTNTLVHVSEGHFGRDLGPNLVSGTRPPRPIIMQ